MSSIRLAAAEDAERVGQVFAAAFADDPVFVWMFGAEGRAEKLRRFFGFLAVEALVPLGATYVSDGSAAAWTPPEPPDWPDERGARFSAVLAEVCTERDRERLRQLNEAVDARHPSEPHWYLSVIGTEPGERGQGRGGALLDETLALVDAAGSPAYLESTNPQNLALYRRHGFVVTDEVRLPDGPLLTMMWRNSIGT